jgi:protein-disulfide isomerase
MGVKCVLIAAALIATAAAPMSALASAPPGEGATIEEQRRWFTEDEVAPTVKPPAYDVTIVEYMDYQCPYCRATHGPLKQLLAKDKKVRVIYRDWPIFGPASEAAALTAVASKYQGKYLAVHDALMETPLPLNQEKIKAAARKAGVDWAQMQKDMAAHSEEIEDLFQRNSEQAESIGLEGTPGFIIGNVQSFGGMTLKQLETSVANARKASQAAARKSIGASGK